MRTGAPLALRCAAMLIIGVMPMPPAISTARDAPSCTGKSFFGASMVSAAPSWRTWCMKREPPRPVSSMRTAITYSCGASVAPCFASGLISE